MRRLQSIRALQIYRRRASKHERCNGANQRQHSEKRCDGLSRVKRVDRDVSSGTRLENPESLGIKGFRLTDPEHVEEVIVRCVACESPVVVNAVVTHLELVISPRITAEMTKGFALYMVQAVLSRKTDEVLELASTDLGRWSRARATAAPGRSVIADIIHCHQRHMRA